MTGPLERRAPAGPSALWQGLSAGLTSRIYLRVAAAASPSHGLCRPPLSGSSRLRRRGLPSEAGARPRAARTHTPTPRAPPPPAFRSASRTPRCPHWARAPRSPRLPGVGSREGVRAPARTTAVPPRRGGRARERGGHPTLGTRPQRASTARAPGWSSAAGLGAGCTRSARPPLSLSPPGRPTRLRAGVRESSGQDAWCIFLGAGLGCVREAERLGGPAGRRGPSWEAWRRPRREGGCPFCQSLRAMFAGGAVAEAAAAPGWVRSSGKTPSPAPPARWYLP